MRLNSIYREDLGFCVENEVSCEGRYMYLYVKMVKVNFFIWLYCIIDDEL